MFQLNWNTETSLWIWLAFGQNGSIPVELGRRHSIKWNLMGMNGPPGTPGRSSSISEEGASLVASFIQLFIAVHLERCRSDPRLKWPRLHIICMSIGSLFPPPLLQFHSGSSVQIYDHSAFMSILFVKRDRNLSSADYRPKWWPDVKQNSFQWLWIHFGLKSIRH